MVFVGADLEGQEVAKVPPCCFLEPAEHILLRPRQPQIDVLRRAGALETKLEDQTSLQHRGVTQHGDDAGEEAIENEELSPTCEVASRVGLGAETLLESLLEPFRRRVCSHGHAARPPKAWRAPSTS